MPRNLPQKYVKYNNFLNENKLWRWKDTVNENNISVTKMPIYTFLCFVPNNSLALEYTVCSCADDDENGVTFVPGHYWYSEAVNYQALFLYPSLLSIRKVTDYIAR